VAVRSGEHLGARGEARSRTREALASFDSSVGPACHWERGGRLALKGSKGAAKTGGDGGR
jgi:hypothetical protein